jgi:lysosomal acid lipase/cholesteryl ester hydrolase
MENHLFIVLLFVVGTSLCFTLDPDHYRETEDLIQDRGFIPENHYVTTEDGYILSLHRIVNPRFSEEERGRPIVLQHGLLSSSRDWIINSPGGYFDEDKRVPGNNLGFELAKLGYDVWMPNSRGNTYSRNHSYLTTKDTKFWNFSISEMIKYDLPATIDYIMEVTGHENLGYIGHSQGTTIMFGLLSTQKRYNNLVKPFIALAPVTSIRFVSTPLRHLTKIPFLPSLLGFYGGPFLPSNLLMKIVGEYLCTSRIRSLCSNAIFIANGFDHTQMNMTRLGVYMNGMPAGTSTKNMLHYLQLLRSGRFQDYDYGKMNNMRMYQSLSPPEYPLEEITNPNIALIHSANDWLSSLGDNGLLRERLQVKPVCDHLVPVPHWNHLDFILGLQQHKYVNKKVYEILEDNKC